MSEERHLVGEASRGDKSAASLSVMGRFALTKILSKVLRWIKQEKTDGTVKVRTTLELMVVHQFPEVESTDTKKSKNTF